MTDNDQKFPEGHFIGMWMGIGIALFAGIGVPISVALGSPALIGVGPAIGVAFGLAIGQSVEAKKKKEGKIRPLTEEEKRIRRRLVIVGVSVVALGVLVFLLKLVL